MGLAAIMRSKTLQQSVLSDLLLWIDNNLDKKLTVDDLSDISGYSPWHLFRLFRHYFDRSPMEYIRQQRMSLCCRLLLTTPGYRIVDICMMVGYDDLGNDSNLLIVFYVQIMPDDLVMQLHRF
ncbi:AraC family transcriptional regulator [Klebsiella pneumoniae]|uniref:AraC family transcriptional regulator n=1 Tax=Klebsiella pneumoniae TaxID=573 RepID=A0A378FRZ9_KLEPN|nr:AraC family transcriptional regulator [Klebsiella pneumoniae]STS21625.1 AraC family transcriptional regulator [Klebsiella pneumoniae]STS53626.1 AraC family transcriptional regulator [Klebsiella pneumoniae]STW34335.1 AraC family transcriptional regulator [Klebsiella pneumoniae]STW46813.1 AraC family transcriptional regulator [Klebsiella pneumoniae]